MTTYIKIPKDTFFKIVNMVGTLQKGTIEERQLKIIEIQSIMVKCITVDNISIEV